MAKSYYTLDKGFLLNYSQQVPLLESYERAGRYEDIGRLVMAAIHRQRDGVPFPQNEDISMDMAQGVFEGIIQARLYGQSGGKGSGEQ